MVRNIDRRRTIFIMGDGVDRNNKSEVLAEIAKQVLVEQVIDEIESQALFTRYYQRKLD